MDKDTRASRFNSHIYRRKSEDGASFDSVFKIDGNGSAINSASIDFAFAKYFSNPQYSLHNEYKVMVLFDLFQIKASK